MNEGSTNKCSFGIKVLGITMYSYVNLLQLLLSFWTMLWMRWDIFLLLEVFSKVLVHFYFWLVVLVSHSLIIRFIVELHMLI